MGYNYEIINKKQIFFFNHQWACCLFAQDDDAKLRGQRYVSEVFSLYVDCGTPIVYVIFTLS